MTNCRWKRESSLVKRMTPEWYLKLLEKRASSDDKQSDKIHRRRELILVDCPI